MSPTSWCLPLAAMTCLAVLAGCSLAEESGESDCTRQVRTSGIVYTHVADTDRPVTKLATAEVAACDDVGRDSRGSYFPEDAQRIQTWRFFGYPTDEVVGVRDGGDTVSVYVADSLPRKDRDRLAEELAGAAD